MITKSNDAFLSGISVFDPVISDHSAVKINLLLQKLQFRKETRNYQKLRSIDYDALCDDINNSVLIKEPSSHLDILVYQCGNVLRSLLDRHAPIKQRVVTVGPSAPWYSGAHLDGHQHGGRKLTETYVTEFCYKSVNLSVEELSNVSIIVYYNTRTV